MATPGFAYAITRHLARASIRATQKGHSWYLLNKAGRVSSSGPSDDGRTAPVVASGAVGHNRWVLATRWGSPASESPCFIEEVPSNDTTK